MAASLGLIGLVTAVYSWLVHVNPTTIALTYVVVVLLIATRWGIAESTAASLLAVLCFNFFFLPPVGTFTIADPQNWVALIVFLLTAIIASQVSGRARRRTVDALGRQRDLERLYAFSRALLLSEGGASVPAAIARQIADTFGLAAVGVYDQRTDVVALGGTARHLGHRGQASGSRPARRHAARSNRGRCPRIVDRRHSTGRRAHRERGADVGGTERHGPELDREPRRDRARTRARRWPSGPSSSTS